MNYAEKDAIIKTIHRAKESVEQHISGEWDSENNPDGWQAIVEELQQVLDQVQACGTGQVISLDSLDICTLLDDLANHSNRGELAEKAAETIRNLLEVKTVFITVKGGMADADFIPYGVEVVIDDKDSDSGPLTYLSPLSIQDPQTPATQGAEPIKPVQPPKKGIGDRPHFIMPECTTMTYYAHVNNNPMRASFSVFPARDDGDDFIRLERGTKNAQGGHDWQEIHAAAAEMRLAQDIAMSCVAFGEA